MAGRGREPLTEAELRRAGLVALGLLFALNVVKVGIVVALAVRAVRQPPRLIVVCFMWLVVGIYVLAITLNGSQLVHAWS